MHMEMMGKTKISSRKAMLLTYDHNSHNRTTEKATIFQTWKFDRLTFCLLKICNPKDLNMQTKDCDRKKYRC